jgi:hypothetical protein
MSMQAPLAREKLDEILGRGIDWATSSVTKPSPGQVLRSAARLAKKFGILPLSSATQGAKCLSTGSRDRCPLSKTAISCRTADAMSEVLTRELHPGAYQPATLVTRREES